MFVAPNSNEQFSEHMEPRLHNLAVFTRGSALLGGSGGCLRVWLLKLVQRSRF